jgi:hypothetical protein
MIGDVGIEPQSTEME